QRHHWRSGHGAVDAADGVDHAWRSGRGRSADAMDPDDVVPRAESDRALDLFVASGCDLVDAPRRHGDRDGMGRRTILRESVVGHAPWIRGYEYAHCRGTGAAFLYSAVATIAPSTFTAAGVSPDVYYEAVVIIIALILTGNAVEARAKRQTSAALHG